MTTEHRRVVDEGLLTQTGRGGLFGDGYLGDRPLGAHLGPDEQPRLVFPSTHRGAVRVHGDAETVYAPGSGYRAIVAITDRRVVIAIGGSDSDGGDQVMDLPLESIDHVEMDTTGRHPNVVLWTGFGTTWTLYPDGLEARDVAKTVENASQAWIRFERLEGDTLNALAEAGRRRAANDFAAANAALKRADETLAEAQETVETFDPSVAEMRHRLARVRRRFRDEQRRVILTRAHAEVERARERWRGEQYERAADHYDRAADIFRTLLDREDLSAETTERIHEQLTDISRDLERLRRAPLACAQAVQRAAERTDAPLEVIDHWRATFERFRTVLALDWGRENPRFYGEKSAIRDRLETAITGLLIARRRAADRCRHHATRLAKADRLSEARDAYEDARQHLRDAIETATEFDPGEVPELRERVEEIEAQLEELQRDSESESTELDPSISVDDSAVSATRAQTSVTGSPEDAASARQPIDRSTAESYQRYVRHLQTLDDGQAVLAAAVIWRELGWNIDLTARETADVLATRTDSERSLLLSVRRRGVPLEAGGIERLADASDDHQADPTPVTVTTDPVAASAYEAAMVRGVTIVDSLRLGELARLTGVRPDPDDEILEG